VLRPPSSIRHPGEFSLARDSSAKAAGFQRILGVCANGTIFGGHGPLRSCGLQEAPQGLADYLRGCSALSLCALEELVAQLGV